MSTLDDAEMAEASLEEVPTALSPTAKTPGPCGGAPPAYAGHLWEEANKALRGLLATKSSINTHQQKLVWELGMDPCQSNSETAEFFKEAKAICYHSTQEAKTLWSTTIKEAKANCTHFIHEAETLCSMTIRDAEAQGASQADSLHHLHPNSIQPLEEQAIKEESKSQLDFLSTCQAALWARPVELCGVLVACYHILMGQAPMSHPFSLSQGASSSRPKWQHPTPDLVDVSPPSRTTSEATPEGPLVQSSKR